MDNNSEICNPFDPREISIDTKTIPMDVLLRRLLQGTIILNPDFQRKEVWSHEAKSRLIESLMLNIPIQMFYVAADEQNNWTVVDGLQRISTFRDFILGIEFLKNPSRTERNGHGFRLTGLEFLKELEGKNMAYLEKHHTALYNRIMETQFSFTIINPRTHEEVKRNIFKRINTAGVPLEPQETRNALYAGPAANLLKTLSGFSIFKSSFKGSKINSNRMEDQEWVLGFIAFLLRPYNLYNRAVSMDDWLSETMIILNWLAEPANPENARLMKDSKIKEDTIVRYSESELTIRFSDALKRQRELFGHHAFRASHGSHRRTPINRRVFETWGVLLSDLSTEEYNRLKTHKSEFLKAYGQLIDSHNFKATLSKHGMDPTAVNSRFTNFSDLIKKYTADDI